VALKREDSVPKRIDNEPRASMTDESKFPRTPTEATWTSDEYETTDIDGNTVTDRVVPMPEYMRAHRSRRRQEEQP
jgi:hypothetical protein